MADKWRTVNQEVYNMCRDAAEEVRVLRVQRNSAVETKDSIIDAYNHGTGWGKGKDE
jgi:hypothetical protein